MRAGATYGLCTACTARRRPTGCERTGPATAGDVIADRRGTLSRGWSASRQPSMMQRGNLSNPQIRGIMKQKSMDAAGGVAAIGVRGRVALVTGAGAANGIGFAAAKLLAAAGAKVAITSTTKRIFDRLKELPTDDENKAAFTADLSEDKDAKALVAAVKKRFGGLDILVNNAGMLQSGRAN